MASCQHLREGCRIGVAESPGCTGPPVPEAAGMAGAGSPSSALRCNFRSALEGVQRPLTNITTGSHQAGQVPPLVPLDYGNEKAPTNQAPRFGTPETRTRRPPGPAAQTTPSAQRRAKTHTRTGVAPRGSVLAYFSVRPPSLAGATVQSGRPSGPRPIRARRWTAAVPNLHTL